MKTAVMGAVYAAALLVASAASAQSAAPAMPTNDDLGSFANSVAAIEQVGSNNQANIAQNYNGVGSGVLVVQGTAADRARGNIANVTQDAASTVLISQADDSNRIDVLQTSASFGATAFSIQRGTGNTAVITQSGASDSTFQSPINLALTKLSQGNGAAFERVNSQIIGQTSAILQNPTAVAMALDFGEFNGQLLGGVSGLAAVVQIGDRNSAGINQSGPANDMVGDASTALIFQTGAANTANTTQSGSGSLAITLQGGGQGNSATIQQSSNFSVGVISQNGDFNSALIAQNAPTNVLATIAQSGTGNVATIRH